MLHKSCPKNVNKTTVRCNGNITCQLSIILCGASSAQDYGKLASDITVASNCCFIDIFWTGFMKHLPNLLKQESSSAATLVHVLLRMYYDPRQEHQIARPQIAERLLPLV